MVANVSLNFMSNLQKILESVYKKGVPGGGWVTPAKLWGGQPPPGTPFLYTDSRRAFLEGVGLLRQNCGAANPGRSRLSSWPARLKASRGQDCPPHSFTPSEVRGSEPS